MTRRDDTKPHYELMEWDLGSLGQMHRVSTDPQADYRYPHGEAAPC